MAGCTLTILGSLIAGLGSSFQPARVLQWFLLICATSFAFNGMMFLLMVRVEDPLVPRAMFGILNTLLYFPSGAIYPVQAFPQVAARNLLRGPIQLCGARAEGDACSRRPRGQPSRRICSTSHCSA